MACDAKLVKRYKKRVRPRVLVAVCPDGQPASPEFSLAAAMSCIEVAAEILTLARDLHPSQGVLLAKAAADAMDKEMASLVAAKDAN